MTRRGFGFLLLTVLVYLAANQTRVGWLYLIAAAMLWTLAVSALVPLMALRGIKASRRLRDLGGRPLDPRSLRPRDGDDVQIEVRLSVPNSPRALVRVTAPCPLSGPNRAPPVFFLPCVTSPEHAVTATVSCAQRGVFAFPPVEVESSAPFGLVRRRRSLAAPAEVVVYPRWYPLGLGTAGATLRAVQAARPRAGAGGAFFGVREYRPGDPVRAIHWRSSLRRGRLVVKEFEDTARPELAIALDLSREARAGAESTLEDSIRLAASLVRWALDTGYPVNLLAPGAPRHALSWPHALDYLARAALDPEVPFSGAVARCPDAAALIVLSPGVDPETRDLLAARRSAATTLVAFTGYGPDPSDQEVSVPAGVGLVRCRPGDDLAAAGDRALLALATGGRP